MEIKNGGQILSDEAVAKIAELAKLLFHEACEAAYPGDGEEIKGRFERILSEGQRALGRAIAVYGLDQGSNKLEADVAEIIRNPKGWEDYEIVQDETEACGHCGLPRNEHGYGFDHPFMFNF